VPALRGAFEKIAEVSLQPTPGPSTQRFLVTTDAGNSGPIRVESVALPLQFVIASREARWSIRSWAERTLNQRAR
jgi:hypothetical protein